MLIGSSTSHKLQVVTSAAASVRVATSSIAVSTATPPVVDGSNLLPSYSADITTAATTDIIVGAAALQKRVMQMTVRNTHASTSNDVTVQRTDGTNTVPEIKATLLAGESLIYSDNGTWLHYDTNGIIRPYTTPLTTKGDILTFDTGLQRLAVGANGRVLMADSSQGTGLKWAGQVANNFSTSTVSAGYAADTYLAGSSVALPSGGPIAGATYRCKFDMVKTAAGVATFTITCRIGTAASTADTARLTFTFAAGTAAADTGLFDVDIHFRTVGSGTSAVIVGTAVCTHHLAATGLISTGASGTGIIIPSPSSGFDSTVANSFIGLSVNGGASFSGTCVAVQAILLDF